MSEIDGSRVCLSNSEIKGGGEYNYIFDVVFVNYPKNNVIDNGEKLKIEFSGSVVEKDLVVVTSELLGHEFLHMLLYHFIDCYTSRKLDNIDRLIRSM